MPVVAIVGAACFGAVIGWVLRFVLAYAKEITVGSLSTIISAVGGSAITAFLDKSAQLFGWYSIGLFAGFFIHVLLFDISPETGEVMKQNQKG